MIALAVYLNGKKLCVAGVDDDGVLSAIVDCVSHSGKAESKFTLAGLISSKKEHVMWINRGLQVSDEVNVRVVSVSRVNRPKKRYRPDPTKELEYQKRYLKDMARKLGWKIQIPK